MHYYPFIFVVFTFFSTMAGGLFVIKFRSFMGAISALAAGVLIAISFLDLLPQSLKLASDLNIPFEYIMYSVVSGFAVLLVAERYFSVQRVHVGNKSHNIRQRQGGWLGATEISLHSFIEGVAIGLSFDLDLRVGIIVAVAILSHDFCDGINVVTVMLGSNNTTRSSIQMLVLAAIAPLLGVILTRFIDVPQQYLVLTIPFLVGGFLFLGASDCLPEASEANPPWVTTTFSLAGFLLIFAVVRVLGV